MLERASFENFKVGDRMVTPARTITEADIVQFAGLTGDWHPLHIDAEFAKGTIFKERIAHGLLVLAVSTGLLFRAKGDVPLLESALALAGLEKARFIAPVKIGDTIRVEGEVVSLSIVDGERGLVTASHRVKNQRGQDVLTYTTKILVERRPQTSEDAHG